MQATYSSETSDDYQQTTQHYIPEDKNPLDQSVSSAFMLERWLWCDAVQSCKSSRTFRKKRIAFIFIVEDYVKVANKKQP
jgi:hypothetical protein